jgi:hypothetical protein
MTYNPAAANWLTLTFDGTYDPNTNTPTAATAALALGGNPASDLSGPITAFGIYRDVTGANFRFDSFTIEGVIPEPTGVTLATLVAGLLFVRQRR